MTQPSLDQLVKRMDSKYTLVVAAAKRGRDLMSGKPRLVETPATKPVSIALAEIAAGRIGFERTKAGVK
ncbi:MAG TPA: DNA-directed RNA polymerase subunit omega [Bacillota bacterium]